jgi:DNA-binding transcriptional regulator YdaS (Cro superfamily)
MTCGYLTEEEIRVKLREACEKAGNQSAFSRKYNVDRSLFNGVLSGCRPVPASMANAIGYQKAIVFIPVKDEQA